jgi:hypothetical protein
MVQCIPFQKLIVNGELYRLQNIFEAVKPKSTTSDKKTVFWNTYKTVADEYDKEFQEKYKMDLDTSLIFVGIILDV